MQESSPLLLPSRPNPQSQQQHDDETNQNNVQQKRYAGAGRKKKKKLTTLQDKVADATRLLKEQIAKANIITSQSHGPSAFSRHEEQQSPESTSSTTSGSREPRLPSPFSPTPYDVTNYNETDSNSYATTTTLFTSSESREHLLLHHHETRLPSPSIEAMDISSPPTTGVTDVSSPSTAVTDYSSPQLGVAFSSPPLEAMGYYSPPPMGVMDTASPLPDIDERDDGILLDYASPPRVEPASNFHLPVHPVYPFSLESPPENKIDWGSDSEDEDAEDGPPPAKASRFEHLQHQMPRLQPDIVLQSKNESSDPGRSARSLPFPFADEAQETMMDEEEELMAPRTISESEVERLHTEKIGNLNGNYDSSGSFHEWHETLRVQTYGGEELLILPYTVIDF